FLATYTVIDCAQATVTYPAQAATDLTQPLYFNLEGRRTVTHQTPLLGEDLARALTALVAARC
ncbi:MAG: hypothetical protein JWM40_1036, partial [Frankiales bacterium]|nr:hypothetical protein [Frankiales bacterium]